MVRFEKREESRLINWADGNSVISDATPIHCAQHYGGKTFSSSPPPRRPRSHSEATVQLKRT